MAINIVEAEPGEWLYHTVERGKQEMARQGLVYGYLKFNGYQIPFGVNSVAEDICVIYSLKCEIERYKKGWK